MSRLTTVQKGEKLENLLTGLKAKQEEKFNEIIQKSKNFEDIEDKRIRIHEKIELKKLAKEMYRLSKVIEFLEDINETYFMKTVDDIIERTLIGMYDD